MGQSWRTRHCRFEDADQRRQRLVHYFDISDTHPSRFSRRVPIWQMRDEYTAEVIDTLESTFGELNDKETLAVAIESAARNAVEDNIPDYLPDLIYSVKDRDRKSTRLNSSHP